MSDLAALNNQLDSLDYDCMAIDVASVWTSILVYWFPPVEGYQLRLNPTKEWVEVYAIRIARRPNETEVTFNPVFMIRCYGCCTEDVPPMGLWSRTFAEIPLSIQHVCRSIEGNGFPAYGAVAFLDTVRLCVFDRERRAMSACGDWPSVYFTTLEGPIPKYLDRVKAKFVEEWGHPYFLDRAIGEMNVRERTMTFTFHLKREDSDRVLSDREADLDLVGDSEQESQVSTSVDEGGYLGDVEKDYEEENDANLGTEDSNVESRVERWVVGLS